MQTDTDNTLASDTSQDGHREDPFQSVGIEETLSEARSLGSKAARGDIGMDTLTSQLLLLGNKAEAHSPDDKTGQTRIVTAGFEAYLAACEAFRGEASLNQRLQDRLTELTALHRINSAANSSLKLNDMLHETAQAVVEVTRADVCTIFLYEPEWDQLSLAAYSGEDQSVVGTTRLRIGESITGWAARAGKPVLVKNAHEDERFQYSPILPGEREVSILAVPVVLFTQEKLLGVITVHTYAARDFSENETKFLETVAGEIAIAIENARLYEQTDSRLRQKVAELSTLQGVSAHIASTLNLQEVLALIAYQSAHLVNADAAAIYELHPESGLLELVAQYDLRDPNLNIYQGKQIKRVVTAISKSGIAHSIMRGVPMQMAPHTDKGLGLPFAEDDKYSSTFCVPLVAPRAIMGGICLYNKLETTFTEEQVRLLDAFGHEAAIALENSRLYDAALRGLQTKSAMLQEMNHRVRNNLQTVAGLLQMQLRRIPTDGRAAKAVRESVSRIQSMAVVHDLMTRGDVESTSLYDLIRKIADAELSTFSDSSKLLAIEVAPEDAESIRIGSHQATLIALLLNELISNAILHGFENRSSGTIKISAQLDKEAVPQSPFAVARIEVADDGEGLAPDFDLKLSANLGLNIVHTLVTSDLRGEFSLEPGVDGTGTVACITFRIARGA